MFGNECLGELSYEAAATTIMMIGLFASFVIGYGFEQLSRWQMSKKRSESIDDAPASTETVKVIIMEAGIIFHSLRKCDP